VSTDIDKITRSVLFGLSLSLLLT